MDNVLAINGGIPVRDHPLPPAFPGAVMYDEQEKEGLCDIIDRQSPFRYYGPNLAGSVKRFERQLAETIGTRYALGVTSCTAALVCTLKACGVGPGDKVIVPACTFLATPGAVVIAGAVPVFCDIDDSLSLDPDALEAVIDPYVKAVIAVPILGNPCRMDAITAVAKKHRLYVIEDVAQSIGSRYRGRHSGSFGDISVFSLQMNKIITTGEGGAVVTNDPLLYERAVRYHDQGMYREQEGFLSKDAERNVFIGQNYRMSELTGAVACAQMAKLPAILSRMKELKQYIKGQLEGLVPFRAINDKEGDASSNIMLLLKDAETSRRFREALNAENIAASYLYNGQPIYMLPQIFHQKTADADGFPFNQFPEKIVYTEDMCPRALQLLAGNVVLPISPVYTDEDAQDIVKGVKKVAASLL